MIEVTGGFGVVIGFVHDWANWADTRNDWDLVARYVVPEVNGILASYRESNRFVIENRATWDRPRGDHEQDPGTRTGPRGHGRPGGTGEDGVGGARQDLNRRRRVMAPLERRRYESRTTNQLPQPG